jgi:hypothetical protein
MSEVWISVCGTISGVIVGGFISYLVSIKTAHRTAVESSKQVAIAEIRGVFAASITRYKIAMRDGKHTPYIDFIIKDEAVKQSLVFEKFRWFIKSKDRNEYQKAWDNYYAGIVLKDYTLSDNFEEKFIKNIENILKFTKL